MFVATMRSGLSRLRVFETANLRAWYPLNIEQAMNRKIKKIIKQKKMSKSNGYLFIVK